MSIELGVGDSVAVIDGPFKDKAGIVSAADGNEVFVKLFILGRISYPCLFEPDNLRLLAKAESQ